MLYAIVLALIVLWIVAMAASVTLGGFVHALLILALVGLVLRLAQTGRTA